MSLPRFRGAAIVFPSCFALRWRYRTLTVSVLDPPQRFTKLRYDFDGVGPRWFWYLEPAAALP